MKKTLLLKTFLISIVFLGGSRYSAQAQVVAITLESGNLASAIAKDASGNIYVLQFNFASGAVGGSGTGEVVKYTNGTGSPIVIYTGVPDEGDAQNDYATGLAVASNGDIYISTDNNDPHTDAGEIIKLKFISGTTYTASVLETGVSGTSGYYAGIALDASNNLYVVQYNINADGNQNGIGAYEIAEYAAGFAANAAPTAILYAKLGLTYLNSTSGDLYAANFPITVAPNGDVYVGDDFDISNETDGGHIYKFTKASGYAISTISTGFAATGLTTDASGDLFALQATSVASGTYLSNYGLYRYANGTPTQTPTKLYTPLNSFSGDLFPYGIAIINNSDVFITDGQVSGGGNKVIQLTGIILPLKLLSFTGELVNNKSQLEWQTADEINTNYFELDRSIDDKSYTPVTTIKSIGTGNNTYSAIDEQTQMGDNYYRLKSVDDDGSFTYSDIVLLKVEDNNNTLFSIYPNPTINQLVISYTTTNNAIINIYNLSGEKLLSQSTNGDSKTTIDVSNLAAGTYLVQYINGTETLISKFVKIN